MKEWSTITTDDELPFTTPLPGNDVLKYIPNDAKILDIACGYGRVLKYFSEKSYVNLTGNDISETLLVKAQRSVPNANFFLGDMAGFHSPEKFDLILLMGAIEYILEDRVQKEFIALICDLLVENGYLYLDSFVLDNFAFLGQYIRGFLQHSHWGRFTNRGGYECHHSSVLTLRSLILEEFEIIIEIRRKIRTWSSKSVNGYSVLARKKRQN